jgi:hypothetical protein
MKKLFLFITFLLVIVSCSKENYDKKELQTKTSSAELKLSTADSIAKMNAGAFLKSTITEKEMDSIAKLSSKLTAVSKSKSLLYSYSDTSGFINIMVWYDKTTIMSQNPKISVSVDDGYVLVGGGAFADDQSGNGAFLTKSWPDDGLTTWSAESKSHIVSNAHNLSVYAVGMKIAGVSPDYVRSKMCIIKDSSARMNHPSIAKTLPSNYIMLGGGVWDDWDYTGGYGNMVVASYPTNVAGDNRTWYVEGKDHRYADPSVIHIAVIGIQSFIVGDVSLDVTYLNTVGYGSGKVQITSKVENSFALIGNAGYCHYGTGWGRMIEALYPSGIRYAKLISKDQTYLDYDYNVVYSIGLGIIPK